MSPRLRKVRTPQHIINELPPNDPFGADLPIAGKELTFDDDDESQAFQGYNAVTPTIKRCDLFALSHPLRESTSSPSDAYLRRKEAATRGRRVSSKTSFQRSIFDVLPADNSLVGDSWGSSAVISSGTASFTPAGSSSGADTVIHGKTFATHARDNVSRERNIGSGRLPASNGVHSDGRQYDITRLPFAPLLVQRLPNGKTLPENWASMTLRDQALALCLNTPLGPNGGKDYEAGLRSTGMSDAQLRFMMPYVKVLASAYHRLLGESAPAPRVLQRPGRSETQAPVAGASNVLRNADSGQRAGYYQVCRPHSAYSRRLAYLVDCSRRC